MNYPFGKIRSLIGSVLFILIFSMPLHAQTAVRLENLLAQQAVSWSEAAVFIFEASEGAAYNYPIDLSNPADAYNYAKELKWLPEKSAPGEPARMNGIALLLMSSFNLKGGIMYSITKSPHHAYRELVYMGIIQGDTDPEMPVSGQQLLLMISRLLSIEENKEAAR